MLASGFEGAPMTQSLLVGLLLSSLAASTTNTMHLLPLAPTLHLVQQRQFWRLLTWQFACSSAADLVSCMIVLYQLRVVERLWGTGKLWRFLLSILPYTTIIPPLTVLAGSSLRFLSPLSSSSSARLGYAYLPSGPSAILFAVLAQYHAAVPYDHRYILISPFASREVADQRLRNEREALAREREDAASTGPVRDSEGPIILTSKSTSYIVPLQLAVSRLPGSLVSAAVGWCAGYAWRYSLLWPSWWNGRELSRSLEPLDSDDSRSNGSSLSKNKSKTPVEAVASGSQPTEDKVRRR